MLNFTEDPLGTLQIRLGGRCVPVRGVVTTRSDELCVSPVSLGQRVICHSGLFIIPHCVWNAQCDAWESPRQGGIQPYGLSAGAWGEKAR